MVRTTIIKPVNHRLKEFVPTENMCRRLEGPHKLII